jgi:hypothetical protein
MSAAPTPLTFAPPLPLTPVRPTPADHAVAADPTPTLRVARDPRTSADEPTGSPARFVWTVPQDSWWWSPGCYAAHGYRPDEVRPTTALFLSHRHRDDLYDYVDALHRAATRTGVVVFEHTTVDVQGTARPVVLLARSFADDGEVQAVHGELLPVGPLHAADVDDWQLSVVATGLQISQAGAAAVLEWRRRREPSSTTECLIGIARTLLLTHRELTIRAQFEEDFLAPWLFTAPAPV